VRGFVKGFVAAVSSGAFMLLTEYVQAWQAHAAAEPGHARRSAMWGAFMGLIAYLYPNPAQARRIMILENREEMRKMGVLKDPPPKV